MHRLRYLVGCLLLAALVAGGVSLVRILRDLDERPGLPLRLEFRDARGLRAGADVRYRGVVVGTVRAVTVAADGQKALVAIQLEPHGAVHARLSSAFWVVTPRFGLTSGTSGLDTLVRDAYLAFHTPDATGSPLGPDSLLTGSERPPQNTEPEALEDIGHGDLLMTLLVPENHGLRPGSGVFFRGMQTGDVRAVRLHQDGTHVEVVLRIARAHRQTVTDKAVFWVARPALSGQLFSGFALTDVLALVSPFVGYYAEPGKGVPVPNGHRAAAEPMRPNRDVAGVPATALRAEANGGPAADPGLVVVRVAYAATEQHTFASDVALDQSGCGVLWLDRAGRAVVVTARSLVDGGYQEPGWFGRMPRVANERLQVLLPSGAVLRAARVWVEPNGRDLAALVLEDVPPDLRGTPAARLSFAGGAPVAVQRVGADGLQLPSEPWPLAPGTAPTSGALLLAGEQAVGVLGHERPRAGAAVAGSFEWLPDDLRPQ
ncbi:MAG: MCE family protein [Planctomycetes bacterium]|nr:MCE family protein [Planctomycetota bacterium]